MSRVHTFLVVLLVLLVASVIHLIGVSLFPALDDSPVADTSGTFNGDQVREDIRVTITVWVPLIMSGGTIVWALVREYRRQLDTSIRRVGPP